MSTRGVEARAKGREGTGRVAEVPARPASTPSSGTARPRRKPDPGGPDPTMTGLAGARGAVAGPGPGPGGICCSAGASPASCPALPCTAQVWCDTTLGLWAHELESHITSHPALSNCPMLPETCLSTASAWSGSAPSCLLCGMSRRRSARGSAARGPAREQSINFCYIKYGISNSLARKWPDPDSDIS